MESQRVAIVYDWIDKWGGVERLLLVLHELFPQADWYTSYYDQKGASWFRNSISSNSGRHVLHTSFIQRLPSAIKKNRIASLLLYPYAFEAFDFSAYDTVISVSSSFAKCVITKPSTRHICILLTPTRFLWSHADAYISPGIMSTFARPFLTSLRRWDIIAAQRPDNLFAISQAVVDRCNKYYHRKAELLYPPFDYTYWHEKASHPLPSSFLSHNNNRGDYFLLVSRLEKYKKIELAIKTFNTLPDKHLIVVGKGSQQRYLHSIANDNISFFHDSSDDDLASLYHHAQALIMPQEEDFGYVALEAQACGCPVIAYSKGGALETVQNGTFYHHQTITSLKKAIILNSKTEHTSSFNPEAFSLGTFKETIIQAVK
ncbi:glycosyltransferase [Candidatus Woesebacteria bacterium]|nr:glycosyltransferase [Candidatus Woesebacteria bacterium]